MQPSDLLSLIVEVGVAIVGFSGIVLVLGRRSTGEWTPLDRARFQGLLNASFLPLAFSGLALVLLAAGLSEPDIWATCRLLHGLAVAILTTFGMLRLLRPVRRGPVETHSQKGRDG